MKRFTAADILATQFAIGHRLPELYRRLLRNNGYGRHPDGPTIYHPLEIGKLYAHHFESDDDLYLRYFPIGCDDSEQVIWIVDVASELVATISHDTHPDDYIDEDWQREDDWIQSIMFA